MSFEVEGKLHKKFDTENKTDTFQAREFVIQTEGQYPQFVKFQLTQDRCQLVDSHNEGDQVKVYFDLRGREWNEKYFTNLNAWKIDKQTVNEAAATNPVTNEAAGASSFPDVSSMPTQKDDAATGSDAFDDLPF
jgi:hypothetical protein